MIAASLLLSTVRSLGCSALCAPRWALRRGLQGLGIDVLLGKLNVRRGECRGNTVMEEPITIIAPGPGESRGDCLIVEGAGEISVESMRAAMPRHPLFIIDLSLWNRHSDVEKREVVEQVMSSINYVREYLWDGNLIISNSTPEFMELFNRYAPSMTHAVRIIDSFPYYEVTSARAAVLDPYGDEASIDDLRRTEVFILGGIVDKERKIRDETLALYRMLNLDDLRLPRYKLTLWGSRVGVPDRINKVMKIVLDVVVMGRGIDEAILAAQSNKDRLQRLVHELQRRGVMIEENGVKRLKIRRSELESVINGLGVNEKVLRRATRNVKLLIIDD